MHNLPLNMNAKIQSFRRVSRPTGSYLCIRTPAGGYDISEKLPTGKFRRLPVNQATAQSLSIKNDIDFVGSVKNRLDAAQRGNNPRLLLTV